MFEICLLMVNFKKNFLKNQKLIKTLYIEPEKVLYIQTKSVAYNFSNRSFLVLSITLIYKDTLYRTWEIKIQTLNLSDSMNHWLNTGAVYFSK